ncbi:MAG: tRNA-His guanylyltransferase [Alectoria fallacina]|uniref:tRNA(His) guanylyltransferase n=1 Tax=Alectoria fallacina TaxID=1903189 RepID=A0A8H3FS97_9LECA|nr:MAG: tRNA-His guanylyltransferase [Alectoria fallacina]
MAKSKYEYVKTFESSTTLLPNTFMVVRIDGRGFHKLSAKYRFEKPNDRQALELMNAAATAVMKELPDINCAYGISDEFRQAAVSSYAIVRWKSSALPVFLNFAGLHELEASHINNLYNTTFWALRQKGGMDATQAEERLKGTLASEKNEILFSELKMNYKNEAEMFKKGSIVYRDYDNSSSGFSREASAPAVFNSEKPKLSKTQKEEERDRRVKASMTIENTDIIRDDFWDQRPWLLSGHLDS